MEFDPIDFSAGIYEIIETLAIQGLYVGISTNDSIFTGYMAGFGRDLVVLRGDACPALLHIPIQAINQIEVKDEGPCRYGPPIPAMPFLSLLELCRLERCHFVAGTPTHSSLQGVIELVKKDYFVLTSSPTVKHVIKYTTLTNFFYFYSLKDIGTPGFQQAFLTIEYLDSISQFFDC